MSSRHKRAYAILAITNYVDNELPEGQRAVIKQKAGEVWAALASAKNDELVDVELSNKLVAAIVESAGSVDEAYALMQRMGLHIGNAALNLFLRLLVKFLKPSLFARKLHDFFRKDHDFGEVVPDLARVDERFIVLNMRGVDGYLYIAPMTMGWIIASLEAMGCRDVKVREVLAPPPAPQDAGDYRFEVTWA